jgi:inner membrane protein
MPTIFTHAFFAAVAGKSFFKEPVSAWFWLLTAVCTMIPDADVIGFSFRVSYASMFGHRGFTHSIVFAVLFGTFAALVARRFLKTGLSLPVLILFFSCATLSHPLLDMLTNGGLGVALFAPFSNERYFFPWRPVEVSPIGFGFFSQRGFAVILSEFIWIWLPAIAIFGLAFIFRRFKK